jgi:hypothetical protein
VRILVVEPCDRQVGQAVEVAPLVGVANRDHDRHRLREQPPRDEPEHLARSGVEPLRVVHGAEQRAFLGHRRQQAEDGEPDQEAVGGIGGFESQGHAQRDLLRLGERAEPIEHRRAELM